MDHKRIVARQLNDELVTLRTRIAVVEAGIKALGGTVSNDAPAPKRSRGRRASAGTAGATSPAPRPPRTRKASGNGADSPELIDKLKAISADTTLTPIQKAQASRKARAAHKRGDTVAAPRPEGAVLGEAAAAEA